MKVNYDLCKQCRIDAYNDIEVWNKFAEAWAVNGSAGLPPYICCPGPHLKKYRKKANDAINKMLEDNFKEPFFSETFNIARDYNHMFMGSDLPEWCPHYREGE